MILTTENTKEFIEFWNNNKPEKFVHPMHEGIATVILDYLDQAEYQLTLEDNKVTVFDQQTNEELGKYTPEELFWKARLLIESNDKGSRSSTNHYNNLLDIFANEKLKPGEYQHEICKELEDYYLTKYFSLSDELEWETIDYTTKKRIEIEGVYYEYDETTNMLSIGHSIVDLENEYGNRHFPEEAIIDGKLQIFDNYSDLEHFITDYHNMRWHSDIESLLLDFNYQTKDILKYFIPKLSDESAEHIVYIIEKQNIALEMFNQITFENIYNKIDENKLSQFEKKQLKQIKEEITKSTIENIVKDITDIVEVFRVNGILISEEDKIDFETFINYHMEINTQSFFKKNEKLYFEDEIAGVKEPVNKEFLLGKLESYIQDCNDSNDEDLQIHKNLFSKYIKESTIKIIYTKDSDGNERWTEYDEKGNEIYFKNSDGDERWTEYDEKGNEIHFKDSDGYERWTEYDAKGNEIHFKNSNGFEKWTEYDENGNVIHYKNSDGFETWQEYDKNGNEIHFKNSDGYERWQEYDEKGNEIHFKNSYGNKIWREYDDKGNVIHRKNSDGTEDWTEYDAKGNVIHFKNSDGFERWQEYDKNGNEIHFKNFDGYEKWTEYDEKGNEIHRKNSNGFEAWTDYNQNGNVIHSKDSYGNEIWREYDEKGNEIHYKDSDGNERWNEYDENGNEIYYKDSDGNERWTEYDENGNEIYYKDSDGDERWQEYDKNGNEIHYKNSIGFERWTEYDKNGNVIHYKNSVDDEIWREYDDKGNEIYYKDSVGKEKWTTVEYLTKEQYLQEKNNLVQKEVMYKKVHFKDSDGYEEWAEYDDKDNQIHSKDSYGNERWYEYDDKGNNIHYKDSNGFERWFEYDDKGNAIHFKDSNGFERWFEYDDKGNEIHSKDSDGYEEWAEYDDKGNQIHSKNFYGHEEWAEYDDKGNQIHSKDSDGYEEWREYDEKGNVIHFKDSYGDERWKEYDDKGNEIHYKTSDGFETWSKYDDKENNIHYKNSKGFERSSTVEYLTKEQYMQEQYIQEKVEQAKKDGYEAGYLFDNDESIISWNELKKIDGIFSDVNLIDVIDEIKESNKNLSEKELKEEVVFRILEDNVDWHGFDYSLIDNEQIDSGKFLDTRCYILEQVSESVVENKINSLENIQNKLDELLLKDSRAKDFFIMDCIKSEINKDFDFWQEIDCDPKGNVNDTIGSYQFLAGISDEVAKKIGLILRDEKEKLNFQYEILGTYEMIPEKFTENGQPFIRFDNREIDFCCNISSDDYKFMKQELFSVDFDSKYSWDVLYKYFDNLVASSMEQTQEYELFLNNPQEYVEKCVLSIAAPTISSKEPMKILEKISKEKSNTENDFRNMLFENMKTSKNPFEATFKIFEELKQKKDTERVQRFNKYLKDNNCTTKKGFEKFFIEIIGLTKNEPKKKHKREFNGFHGIER